MGQFILNNQRKTDHFGRICVLEHFYKHVEKYVIVGLSVQHKGCHPINKPTSLITPLWFGFNTLKSVKCYHYNCQLDCNQGDGCLNDVWLIRCLNEDYKSCSQVAVYIRPKTS